MTHALAVLGGLLSVGWTHIAAVLRELLFLIWIHIEEFNGELSPMGGTAQCRRGRTPLLEQQEKQHSLSLCATGVGGTSGKREG